MRFAQEQRALPASCWHFCFAAKLHCSVRCGAGTLSVGFADSFPRGEAKAPAGAGFSPSVGCADSPPRQRELFTRYAPLRLPCVKGAGARSASEGLCPCAARTAGFARQLLALLFCCKAALQRALRRGDPISRLCRQLPQRGSQGACGRGVLSLSRLRRQPPSSEGAFYTVRAPKAPLCKGSWRA